MPTFKLLVCIWSITLYLEATKLLINLLEYVEVVIHVDMLILKL